MDQGPEKCAQSPNQLLQFYVLSLRLKLFKDLIWGLWLQLSYQVKNRQTMQGIVVLKGADVIPSITWKG